MIRTCLQCGKNFYADTEADTNAKLKAHHSSCPNAHSGETRRQRSFHRERDRQEPTSPNDASRLTQNKALIELRREAKAIGIDHVSKMNEKALTSAIKFRSAQVDGGIDKAELLDFTVAGKPITPQEISDNLTVDRMLTLLTDADVKMTKKLRDNKAALSDEIFKRKLYKEVI